ncbi:glycosyl hydrolase family 18 protein [Streptomyces sp. NPDC048340]|uniref:glycosyl hydrolase family 18 protein n=1 Tax=Streptomyces sp. NPDC048340 TaxID=3365537 RepID=UPI0037182AC9
MSQLLGLALIAGLLQTLLLPAGQAAADVGDHTVASWNLQAKAARLQYMVPYLMREKRLEIMALQEIPEMGEAMQFFTGGRLVKDVGTRHLEESSWSDNGQTYYLYRVVNDRSQNRGVGIVSTVQRRADDLDVAEMPGNREEVSTRGRDGAVGVVPRNDAFPFPAVGVRLGAEWFYSIHATNGSTRRLNNAAGIVRTINDRRPGEHWAALGDWNRHPSNGSDKFAAGWDLRRENPLEQQIDNDPAGVRAVYSNQRTHRTWVVKPGDENKSKKQQKKIIVDSNEIDYLVSNGAAAGYAATRMDSPLGSDHYPVVYSRNAVDPAVACPLQPVQPRTESSATAGGLCEETPEDDTSDAGSAIVSMGDSYISGEGGRWAGNALTKQEGDVWGTDRRDRCRSKEDGTKEDCVYDATSYEGGNKCDRSDVAPIKGAEFEDVPVERRFNLACSGATTKNIVSDSLKGEKPQVQQLADLASSYDIRMVVVSIGGNDLDFSGIMTGCALAFFSTALNSTCVPHADRVFSGKLDTVRADVTNALTEIRRVMSAAGQSNYQLVLQSYPSPLPATDDFRYPQGTIVSDRFKKGGCPFRDKDADWARNSMLPRITGMLRQAAGMAGAKFLNVQDAFAGHELCAKTAQQATDANNNTAPLPAAKAEWIRWVPYVPRTGWVTPNAQGDVQEAVHPNAFGQQALSQCLTEFGKAAPGSDRYIFGCAGSNDGMKVAPDPSVVREGIVRLRNARTNEVLDAEGQGDDDYLVTHPADGRTSQRWLLHNVDGQVSLQAQHNGRYLAPWNSWTYLGGAELGWEVSREADGRVVLSIGKRGRCLAQDPGKRSGGKNWVSHDYCRNGVNENEYWYLDYQGDVVITPRDTDSGTDPREGQQVDLRSATGMAVDLSGSNTAAGTSVQAYEPNGSPAQHWVMRALGGGNWRIASALSPGMVVDHDPGPHTTHLIAAEEGNANQVWQPKGTGTGWYALVSGADGQCLTAGAEGSALAVTACDANDQAQRWKFRETGTGTQVGTIRGLGDKCVEPRGGSRDDRTPVRLSDCAGSDGQAWTVAADGSLQSLAKCLDIDGGRADNGTAVQLYVCNGSPAQKWIYTARQELRNPNSGKCLDVPGSDTARLLQIYDCNGRDSQKWQLSARPVGQPDGGDAGDPFDASADGRGTKPAVSGDCRPEGMTPTQGVAARYCDVYDGAGREWVGNERTRRVVGYFTGWRAGKNGDPKYLASNIPWSKITHVNYAFADVQDNRISIGDPNDPANPATGMTWPGDKNAMDASLPYKGHFNLLNTYKRQHPAVKTLISVGGWAGTRNFYATTTNADGSVNQSGIDAFADSVTAFLDQYGFNGVDIDYEYPTALPNTGNPLDWDVSNPRRRGLQQGYNALMKTLREKLDRSGADRGRYYLLTSAGSSSGYLVRGLDAGQALQYQDYVNVMTYDLHGSWNKFVGPQAPLYDDGRDNELADAGIYDDQAPDTKDFRKEGYFNTDWAYHYYRGALPAGRINLGIPYYSRGWRDVQGGTDGLWGTAAMPDQAQCPLGTGGRGPVNAQSCGLGAVGIDNLWHDLENDREVGAGSNPLWHTKNLQDGRTPGYLRSYGVDTELPSGQLTGSYAPKYSDALQASWLWNDTKKVFLSTENEKSLDAKARYIVDKGIGGAMIWELAGDYTQRPGGAWGMGYDLTTRLDNAFKGAGATGNAKAGGRPQPTEVIDVKAELVDFPTGEKDFYPVQPKLRITNNSGVALAQGTEISLDLPTSTPPIVKDNDYKEIKGLVPGHTGPNTGGLQGDFHRLTITLGYCEDLAPGASRDIDLKYYLPVTGPSNVTFRIGGQEFGSTGDQRRGVRTVTPPAPAAGNSCQAPDWREGQVYRPDGGRLWRMYDKGDKGWMFEYGDSRAGKPMVIDNNPDRSRAHLVELMDQNPNQYWQIQPAGGGLYSIASGGRCLTATASRQDIASLGCSGRNEQKWQLVPISDNGSEGTPGGAKHSGLFKLRSTAGNDIEVAGGATARETHLLTGDPAASTAAFVKYQGSYWYAQWYTTAAPGTAEANGGRPWKKLSPTP